MNVPRPQPGDGQVSSFSYADLDEAPLPTMNGMEFYDALGDVAPELARRVAFLTGGAFTAASQAFLERVDSPRLQKPFDLSALLETIGDIAEANVSPAATP